MKERRNTAEEIMTVKEKFDYYNWGDYRTCLYVAWDDPVQRKTLMV